MQSDEIENMSTDMLVSRLVHLLLMDVMEAEQKELGLSSAQVELVNRLLSRRRLLVHKIKAMLEK